jgi:hypothetical protein
MLERTSRLFSLTRAREWLRLELEVTTPHVSSPRGKLPWVSRGLVCIAIFGLAVGVRALQWQDSHVQTLRSTTSLMGVFNRYRKETNRILAEGAIVFPRDRPAPGDARMLAHPPGYSILMAAIERGTSRVYEGLWLVQVVGDGLAALLIFLIATKLVGQWIGFIAGILVAISPQLAYYSLLLTPDSLAVLPVIASVYFLVLAMKKPKLSYLILSGALMGLSCWLGANAMGLALFFGLLVPLLFESGKRVRYSVALVGAGLIVIAPITIRNLIAYNRLIPISIQAGLSVAEGIGDFDREGKLGMPRSDEEARIKDVEWSGRPEYVSSLWVPDGIERDRIRLSRGLAVIRARPIWFLGVMLQRAAFMLRYNDSASHGWPQDSSIVGFVQQEPPFSHQLTYEPRQDEKAVTTKALILNGQLLDEAATVPEDAAPVWSVSPMDLLASGRSLSSGTQTAIEDDGQRLAITGDSSDYGNQFASAPIGVEPYTDYILVIRVAAQGGSMAVKVLSPDMKVALSSLSASDAIRPSGVTKIKNQTPAGDEPSERAAIELREVEIQAPFASGPRTKLYMVFSNNGRRLGTPALGIQGAKLMAIGPTGGQVTRIPRVAIRTVQKTLFTTSHMLPLIFAGLVLVGLAKQFRTLVVVMAVPVYYLSAQSVLHTEYRYILAIHYFAFIFAGVALYCAISFCYKIVGRLTSAARHAHGKGHFNQASPEKENEH